MRLPGFTAGATLSGLGWSFYRGSPGVQTGGAAIVPAFDPYGACNTSNGPNTAPSPCAAALWNCQYYTSIGGGSDPSYCCRWWVENCELPNLPPAPPGGGGGGGGGVGGGKRHPGPLPR
jgi:hypothetical protein